MMGLNYNSPDEMPPGMKLLYEAKIRRASGLPALPVSGQQEKEKPRKYHNTPTERMLPNGEVIKFGSKKEAAYYDQLRAREKAGQVRNIRLQYQYLLKPAYTDGETGERFRAISYLADFVFEALEDGKWTEHIVDTKGGKSKGTRTGVYVMKRKMMAEQGHRIEEA